jgi:hypothetical protein
MDEEKTHFNEMSGAIKKNASAIYESFSKYEGVPVPLDGDSTSLEEEIETKAFPKTVTTTYTIFGAFT